MTFITSFGDAVARKNKIEKTKEEVFGRGEGEHAEGMGDENAVSDGSYGESTVATGPDGKIQRKKYFVKRHRILLTIRCLFIPFMA